MAAPITTEMARQAARQLHSLANDHWPARDAALETLTAYTLQQAAIEERVKHLIDALDGYAPLVREPSGMMWRVLMKARLALDPPETCECCNAPITAGNRYVTGGAIYCSLTCESRGCKAQEASR